MLDAKDILAAVKRAAREAVEESDPTRVMYGEITEADEETGKVLGVKIDQQLEFDEEQTDLKFDTPAEYRERKVKIRHPMIAELRKLFREINESEKFREVFTETYDLCEDDGCAEDELIISMKDFLKKGDKVIITQAQGGQKFAISGRLDSGTGNE